MRRMWEIIVLPLFKELKPKNIVEIGSEDGINTEKILSYCIKNNSYLITIDPHPLFDENKFSNQYGDHFKLIKDLSLNCLQEINDYDVILIDGDHNWYTVYNELKLIEKKFIGKKFPIIILHDVGWPYGRRDLYYNPKTIPKEFLHEYAKKGMLPDTPELLEKGGLNCNLNNAIYENGAKNGVLTAIEDFLHESKNDLSFSTIMAFNGLGIIYPNESSLKSKINNIIEKSDITFLLEKSYLRNMILSMDKISELESSIVLLNKELTQEKIKFIDENNNLMETNKTLNNINSSLVKSRQIVLNQRDDLVDENEKLANRIVDLVNSNNDLLNKYNDLVDENEKLANRNVDLVKSKCVLLDKCDGLSMENEKLLNRNNILTQTKVILYNENKKLNGEKVSLLNDYLNLLEQNNMLIKSINSLKASISQYRIENNNQKEYINKLSLENDNVNDKFSIKRFLFKVRGKLWN
ncbi:methyltransferase domain-containing protein [Methanobrevibacter millerae]|uniref:Methyltransferase domain-containing protein n=2 Tax=Methanobrevibacter millerae TaxID=230361 RepID=A0A0U3EDM4_9EURY|nr:methyltransferase domain-containing protein [Methanobrevibacter millerae]